MPQTESPIVQQRRLRAELRRARDHAGLTQKAVAEELDWHPSKVIRIETGAVTVATADLMALLQLYGVDERQRVRELLDMAKVSRQQAWWDEYRNVYSAQFLTFLGYEASATRIRQFQVMLVPGILQTPEYVRDIVSMYSGSAEKAERSVKVRMKRQELLTQQDGPEMSFILDEAVLRRQVAGRDAWRRQLERLVELNHRDNISIQVVPFEIGSHPGVKGSFEIFEFPYEEEDYAVLLEGTQQDTLIQNDPEQASLYVETFSELEQIAAPASELEAIVDRILGNVSAGVVQEATS